MHIPIIIGGGGIVGLLFYYEFQKAFPEVDCVLLEGSKYFGDMSTGRNSGVIHGGLYYPQHSLKKEMCIEGNRMWDKLSIELGVEVRRCGKFIVTSSINENIRLLFENAKSNGVLGLRETSREERSLLNQLCHHKESFFCESTGVISPSEVVKSLQRKIEARGGILMKEHSILRLEYSDSLRVYTNKGDFSCDYFINALGGLAPKLRKMMNLNDIDSYWVKGNYLKYNRPFYNESLIYPLPPQNKLGLGVHTSFDLDGIVRFGPDTEIVDEYEHQMKESFDEMISAIEGTFKNIDSNFLTPDYCGIRSKIKVNGSPYNDFIVNGPEEHGVPGYIEYLGIDSPGLTSAPALVKKGLNFLKIGS